MARLPIINNLRVVPRLSDFLNRKLGQRGEIYYDDGLKTLRVYDGETTGGIQLTKADLSNVSNQAFAAKATAAGVGGSGGNTTVTVGDETPSEPENGNLWLNTNTGYLYVYIDDGDTEQWIQPAFPTFSGEYDDLNNKPAIPTNVSDLTNDLGYLTAIPSDLYSTILADDSTLLVDATDGVLNTYALSQVSATAGQVLTWSDGNSRWEPNDVSLGSFSFITSNIDTTDSSAITVTPAVTMQSDLTVENELNVLGQINGYISLTDIQAVVAASTDFDDFKARIAAL